MPQFTSPVILLPEIVFFFTLSFLSQNNAKLVWLYALPLSVAVNALTVLLFLVPSHWQDFYALKVVLSLLVYSVLAAALGQLYQWLVFVYAARRCKTPSAPEPHIYSDSHSDKWTPPLTVSLILWLAFVGSSETIAHTAFSIGILRSLVCVSLVSFVAYYHDRKRKGKLATPEYDDAHWLWIFALLVLVLVSPALSLLATSSSSCCQSPVAVVWLHIGSFSESAATQWLFLTTPGDWAVLVFRVWLLFYGVGVSLALVLLFYLYHKVCHKSFVPVYLSKN